VCPLALREVQSKKKRHCGCRCVTILGLRICTTKESKREGREEEEEEEEEERNRKLMMNNI